MSNTHQVESGATRAPKSQMLRTFEAIAHAKNGMTARRMPVRKLGRYLITCLMQLILPLHLRTSPTFLRIVRDSAVKG